MDKWYDAILKYMEGRVLLGRLVVTFKAKPIELISSAIMMIIGFVLPLIDPKLSVIGSVLGTFGGILISWSASSISSISDAVALISPQLDTASRHLGSVSSQLRHVAESVVRGDCDSDAGFALVMQANQTLYGLVSDIQRLIGKEFNAQDLISTVDRIEELAAHLARPITDSEVDDEEYEDDRKDDELRAELQQLRFQLGSQLGTTSITPVKRVPVTVNCPKCNQKASVPIGASIGSTAQAKCAQCGERFNIHRAADGNAFTRTIQIPQPVSMAIAASEPDAIRRVLTKQGIRLVAYSTRAQIAQMYQTIFMQAPSHELHSWQELDAQTLALAVSKGISVTESEIKAVRAIAYKAIIFDLTGGPGHLRLQPTEDITKEMDQFLIGRIVGNITGQLQTQLLLDELFQGDAGKMPYLSALLEKVEKSQPGSEQPKF